MNTKTIATQYGGRTPNPLLMSPEPNTTYLVSPNPAQLNAGIKFVHTFVTDAKGFVESASVDKVQFFKGNLTGVRHQIALPGRPLGNHDRGHIISAELGAGMEFINLLWMPNAVNRRLSPEVARRYGHSEIADQMDRHLERKSFSGGTLSGTGEFYLPNYRIFEEKVKLVAGFGEDRDFKVSVLIKPSTFEHDGAPLTDILYTEIFADDKRILRYKIASDVSS